MATSLVPCPSCARHVRASERACPFCRSMLPSTLASKAIPGATQRLSRAAAFTFAATLAATGCSDDPAPPADAAVLDTGNPSDTGTDTGSATDTGTDTGSATDAGFPADDGGIVAMYGGPPDSGADSGAPDDNGGVAPLYGLPAPDAGTDQDAGPDGSMILRYGSPPRPDDAGV
jgi:hypothetical protein